MSRIWPWGPTARCISAPAAATRKGAFIASFGREKCPTPCCRRAKEWPPRSASRNSTAPGRRQHVAIIKQKLGAAWDAELPTIADNDKNKPESRCRALELMQLLGPFPGSAQLLRLSRDADDLVRAKDRLPDGHPCRRGDRRSADRIAARHQSGRAADLRASRWSAPGKRPTWTDLVPLLVSPDRYVSYAATRALEQIPKESWQAAALEAKNHRVFLQGAWRCW